MFEIKCLDCDCEDRRLNLDDLYCGNCGNERESRFEVKKWKLHKLLKPEIIEKSFKIDELSEILSNRYGIKSKTGNIREWQQYWDWRETQQEYKQIKTLKYELVKYFEWCYEKFGIDCLEYMHDSFDDYCFSIRKRMYNPLRLCELSDKIGWVN